MNEAMEIIAYLLRQNLEKDAVNKKQADRIQELEKAMSAAVEKKEGNA